MHVNNDMFGRNTPKNRRLFSRILYYYITRIRVSITSLQICKLVSLVTSRNRSRVSFLICKSFRDEARQDSEQLTHSPLDTSQYTELKTFTQFNQGQSSAVLYQSKNIFLPFDKAFAQAGWCFGTNFQR